MRAILLFLLPLLAASVTAQRAALDVTGGLDYTYRTLMLNEAPPVFQQAVDLREEWEVPIANWHVGLHYGRQIGRQWSLRAGVRLSSLGYALDGLTLTDENNVTPPDGEARTARYVSRFRFLEVPLLLRRSFGTGRWKPSVEVGFLPGKYLGATDRLYIDGKPWDEIRNGRANESVRDFHLSATLAAGVAYAATDVLDLFVQPAFRYQLTNMRNATLSERHYAFALEVGVRRNFQ